MQPARVIGPRADEEPFPELIEAVREGRTGSLERLIGRVERRVRLWAFRLVGDADDADDVTQEILITLERRVRKFAGNSQFSTWLYQVTRNAALARLRRDGRRARALKVSGEVLIPQPAHHASDDVDERTLTTLIARYVDELPPRQRIIFQMADLEGKSTAEIALALGIEPVTVRTNLFKARRAIRMRILERHPRLLEEYLT